MRKWPSLLTLWLASASAAEVIHVPADQPTIQAGIDAAKGGDEVVIADGVYSGTGNTNLNYHGKAIRVRSANGSAQCVIDCQGERGRMRRAVLFESQEGPDSIFQGLTVRGGRAPFEPGEEGRGGAIRALDASPTIRDCIFEDNQAGSGGAIACRQTTLIERCFFRNNQATIGGALFVQGACRVEDCVIRENTAFLGAAILMEGPNTLSGCRVLRNVGGSGAAVLVNEDGAQIIGCLLAVNIGDALRAEVGSFSVENCTIADHFVGRSIVLFEESASISNCIVANGGLGSIILAAGAEATVTHSLVTGGWPGEGNIDGDPQFVTAFADDPFSQLYRLRPASLCVDAGSNGLVPARLAIDLDGYPRILDGDIPPDGKAVVDMGCFEFVRSRKLLP